MGVSSNGARPGELAPRNGPLAPVGPTRLVSRLLLFADYFSKRAARPLAKDYLPKREAPQFVSLTTMAVNHNSRHVDYGCYAEIGANHVSDTDYFGN
jgi:hypothetical protein